ncbi:hypothetical protein POM88_006438 [Heracleum sosnowskyi]|uniref:laccase n=1 Tax=Heracleum sosnowskyi TaxID=360622 RepID=A0AAD8J2L2_9APIA|nr:hypothetical protein POM88_006438 [Heracleum sosnowskyi]
MDQHKLLYCRLRSTVNGAIVIHPKLGAPYPFPKPHREIVVVLGLAPNVSDAHTINDLPGLVSGCATQNAFQLSVDSEKSYMLRIVNVALNEELLFKIVGHKLTVVEVNATCVQPFKTDTILISPGQTTNVIVDADQNSGKYLVAVSPFMDSPIAVDNVTSTATLHYTGTLANTPTYFQKATTTKCHPHCRKLFPITSKLKFEIFSSKSTIDS